MGLIVAAGIPCFPDHALQFFQRRDLFILAYPLPELICQCLGVARRQAGNLCCDLQLSPNGGLAVMF